MMCDVMRPHVNQCPFQERKGRQEGKEKNKQSWSNKDERIINLM